MRQGIREPTVVVRGDVPDAMVTYARTKVLAAMKHAPSTLIDVEVRIDHHSDPARERANHVGIAVDIDGTPVHAHADGATVTEAVDRAVARLRRRMEATEERRRSHRRNDGHDGVIGPD